MTKYIAVYEAIGDGSKDRGEKLYSLALAKDSISKTTQTFKVLERYPLSDVVSVDCYHSDKLQEGNVAGGAAAGLLVGGIAGAVVGGLLNAGAKQSWVIEITLKDRTLFYRLNTDNDKAKFVKWADKLGILKY